MSSAYADSLSDRGGGIWPETSNPHFARLADEYHDVNRHIHRHESGVQPASETHETELRKRRIVLKDELYAMLKA